MLLALTLTVFLKEAFFDKSTNAELLSQKLQTMAITLTSDQATNLAKVISKPFWEWHIILGYVLIALLVYRALLLFDKKTNPEKPQSLHKKIVKIGYKLFYIALVVFAITGLMMVFKTELTLSKEIVGYAKEIHKLLFYTMWFIPLHVIGVVMEHKKEQNQLIDKII